MKKEIDVIVANVASIFCICFWDYRLIKKQVEELL
jgi:hypothetical protein